ncbi:MAG: C40 family peptidase [Lachnospiraceae bacterium]|nr:C40 family peptidase [Lachnospiraceae bacterium]
MKNTMKKVTTGICVLGTAVLINQALLAPNVLTVKAAQAEIALSVGSATVLGSDRDAEASKTEAESVTTAEAVDTTIAGYTNLGIAHVDNYLNVRETAGEDGKLVGKMSKNAGCEILGVEGDWTKIKSGKVEGYVKSEYLYTGEEAKQVAAEAITMMATVTNTQSLRVRTGPSMDASTVDLIPLGEKLEVLEDLGDWVKVTFDSDEGYISSEFVEMSEELETAVTITELQYGEGVSDARVSIVQYAKQFLGNPYVWGGSSLTNGTDCSGFTMSIYAKYGVSLPHSSRAQANCGTRINSGDARPGDLFFYGNGSGINHVAMYIGGGQVIHASTERTGIKISNAYYRTPVCVVSLLGN